MMIPSPFGGTVINFNNDTVLVQYEYREMNFDVTNSSICSTEGELLFYTNGIYIADQEGELMENGDSLNPDPYTLSWAENGLILPQGALSIPKPNHPDIYYLFHESLSFEVIPDGPIAKPLYFYYSLIDMNENNGLGKVLEKNVPLIQDTLDLGKITSSRHANGRDWWIIFGEFNKQSFYIFLLSPNGIEPYDHQLLPNADNYFSGLGQAVFTPDGTKYVRLNLHNLYTDQFIDIFDFDRCTGEFSNPIQITYIDTAYAGGVAISPNNQYLYVSSFKYIYQYDLEANDIEASKQIVAILDGFQSESFGLYTTFFLAQLAPDNKIYINANNSVEYMHIIHNPNAGGEDCQIEQHGLVLSTLNSFSMPNNPYFRLGPLDGSPCDTLGLDNHPKADFYHIVSDTLASFWDYSLFAPTEWKWDFGDGSELSYEQNPQHIYAQSGIYEVCLTVSNDNASDTHCEWVEIIITDTQVPDSPVKNPRLFPNPVGDYFYFSYHSDKTGSCTLYDALGRAVLQRPLLSGNVTQAWDAHRLAAGVYYLMIEVEGQVVFSEKVMKL